MSATIAAHTCTLNDALDRLINRGECELPVLPEVASQLLRMTSNVDCDVSEIVALIRRDQSLTSHLLRTANSPRYSTGVTVSSVQQAVARLGLLCIREVVVLISCQCRIFDLPEFFSDVRDSFRRSLATAAFSQEIARVRRTNVEEAFLSGLLHDAGRPVLLQALSDCRRLHGMVVSDDEVRRAADQHRIAMGTRLVRSWELSSRIAEAVEYQDSPSGAPTCAAQAATVRLAADLAEELLFPGSGETREPNPMVLFLNLYPEQLETVLRNQHTILEWVNSTT